MSGISKTAEATRAVLKLHRDEALDGTLTLEAVVSLVRQVVPKAQLEGIYQAVAAYGPIGEDDQAWIKRAEKPQIPSWFYDPRTGESLS